MGKLWASDLQGFSLPLTTVLLNLQILSQYVLPIPQSLLINVYLLRAKELNKKPQTTK